MGEINIQKISYGGHRLWHSPESKERTYKPDNSPVAWEKITDGIRTIQNIEPISRIKKEMEISPSLDNTMVTILHRSDKCWSMECRTQCIGVLRQWQRAEKRSSPLSKTDTGLLPNQLLAIWPYTRLNDSRIYFGERFIVIQQDPTIKQPLKIGLKNEEGWAAYFNHGHLFVKYYEHIPDASYPDFGASYETYTNDFMLEMETLSPLVRLEPGKSTEHIERWRLFDNISMPSNDEIELEKILLIV